MSWNWKNLVPWKWGAREVPVRKEGTHLPSAQHDMGRMLDSVFQTNWNNFLPRFMGSSEVFAPRVNVSETDGEITVTADLPGMDESDINLSLKDDSLCIRGKKEEKRERKDGEYTYYESSYGSFERVVPLYCEIDQDEVEASAKKGVLTIKLPKAKGAEGRSRQISVKTA